MKRIKWNIIAVHDYGYEECGWIRIAPLNIGSLQSYVLDLPSEGFEFWYKRLGNIFYTNHDPEYMRYALDNYEEGMPYRDTIAYPRCEKERKWMDDLNKEYSNGWLKRQFLSAKFRRLIAKYDRTKEEVNFT